jgi:membrane protein DedA with SNARE-associated domain
MSLEFFSLENIQEIARQYGYLAVFMGILLENTGIPLPGETITVVGGFLAGSGELNYWLLLSSAIVGAVVGDNFGYWIGRIGGWQFLQKIGKIFSIPEKLLEETKIQFGKNAPKAVFFGRFITLLRIFAGPMAGIAQMPYQQFFLCNLGGATLWALTTITLSSVLGRLIPLPKLVEWIAKFGIFALLLVIASIGISFWWRNRPQNLKLGERLTIEEKPINLSKND